MPLSPTAVRPTARRVTRAVILAAVAAAATAACRGTRDDARAERDTERQEIRRAAEEAARLATSGDTGRPARDGVGRDTGSRVNLGATGVRGLTRAPDPPLGPGDMRVTSTDGAVVYTLVGDGVRIRLGDSVLAKVRNEIGSTDTASGIGGLIASTVKGAVGGAVGEALQFAVRIPVAEIRDLRYEDGRLHFSTRDGTGRRGRTGEGTNSDARFARADAERFIAAVRARQRALGVRG